MFKIKICGVTDVRTAGTCCAAGADAIGLNFYAKSKRWVDDKSAATIANQIGSAALKIGLFVNHDRSAILDRAELMGLDGIQLHGDESIDVLDGLQSLPSQVKAIRAVRISRQNLGDALRQIEQWSGHPSGRLGAILLDPLVEQEYGGTGHRIDWNWLNGLQLPTDKPIILAGGLTPENVANAISIVRPHGVDVAGGVEDPPGRKDAKLIKEFVVNAKNSFDRR